MDFHSSLKHLASSLKPQALNISPNTWNIFHVGSSVNVNIEFEQCISPQEAQVHVINHPVRTFHRKSPSTLRRDRTRHEKYMKKLANQSLDSHERQIGNHSLYLNVHAAEFEPKTLPVHNPKPDDCDLPFTDCETCEILHTMDRVDVLKTDLIQTKLHLQSATQELKSLKHWNADYSKCNSELNSHVSDLSMELQKMSDQLVYMKEQEDSYKAHIRDLGQELQESHRPRSPAVHHQDAGYHEAKEHSNYKPHKAYGYHGCGNRRHRNQRYGHMEINDIPVYDDHQQSGAHSDLLANTDFCEQMQDLKDLLNKARTHFENHSWYSLWPPECCQHRHRQILFIKDNLYHDMKLKLCYTGQIWNKKGISDFI